MSIKEVSLPTGGRVWLRTRLTHAQARERDDARAALPGSAVARTQAALDPDRRDEVRDDDLAIVTAAVRHIHETTIRVCVARSADVHDPDGGAISLPDDLDRLDEQDFGFLVEATDAALAEGFGDPESSRGSSATPSSRDASEGTSPRTFGTPS